MVLKSSAVSSLLGTKLTIKGHFRQKSVIKRQRGSEATSSKPKAKSDSIIFLAFCLNAFILVALLPLCLYALLLSSYFIVTGVEHELIN
jgi:hypothetical protein